MVSETHFLQIFLSVFLCLHNLAEKWQPCLTSKNIKKKKPGHASHSRQVSMHYSVLWLLVWTGMLVAKGKREKEQVWLETVTHEGTLWVVTYHWFYLYPSVKPTAYTSMQKLLLLSYVIALFWLWIHFFMIRLHWVHRLWKYLWVCVCAGGGLCGPFGKLGYQCFLYDGLIGIWLQSCKGCIGNFKVFSQKKVWGQN